MRRVLYRLSNLTPPQIGPSQEWYDFTLAIEHEFKSGTKASGLLDGQLCSAPALAEHRNSDSYTSVYQALSVERSEFKYLLSTREFTSCSIAVSCLAGEEVWSSNLSCVTIEA
ncbi:hypothetical protein RRG08_018400 [Elysia crispata]|uniref:Uncharacterized protein n=1 Tax=Elysia crispata TaxID=231223 RepID=A0AAE0ZE36_9GAST|nr:hypothetical protein RRG08_018400 [Elysia crispata]